MQHGQDNDAVPLDAVKDDVVTEGTAPHALLREVRIDRKSFRVLRQSAAAVFDFVYEGDGTDSVVTRDPVADRFNIPQRRTREDEPHFDVVIARYFALSSLKNV